MTYTDTSQRDDYTATSGQTVFAYTFRILTKAELKVYDDGTLKTLTTDYTVSGVGDSGGGNVTFGTGITSGNAVLLIRATPNTQETDYTASGPFAANDHETALDKLAMNVQDMEEKHARAVKFPITSTLSDIDFPEGTSATDRATKVPAYNSAGTDLELIAATNVDATSVIASKGDIVQGNASGAAAKLAIGANGAIAYVATDLLAYLAIGSSGQVLTVSSGIPSWVAAAGGGGTQNKIINGDMSVSQRGTSFTSTSSANDDDSYTLDRWNLLSDGNDAVDVTQQTSGGVAGTEAYIRLDVETAQKKFGIIQFIENKNLKDIVGGSDKVSLSFEAKVTNATKLSDIRAVVLAWDSTADTVTSDVVSAWGAEGSVFTPAANWTAENTAANLSVTTSWVRYTIEDIAIDTVSTTNVAVMIYQNNVATNDTAGVFLEVTNVQLEEGATANLFDYEDVGTTLFKCKRYYENLNNQASASFIWGIAQCTSTTVSKLLIPYVEKRGTPTLDKSADGDFKVSNASGASEIDTVGVTVGSISRVGCKATFTVASGLVAGNAALVVDDTGGNSRITIDAEL